MPAIALAAFAYLTTSATVWGMTAATIYFMAAVEAVAIIGSYLAYQSAKGKFGEAPGSGALVNTRSAEETLPVLYGRHRIGGNQVYVHATGENNKYLHIIQTISEGPIEGIEQIYLDDKPASEYGSLVYYELFNGSGDQGVCTTLKSDDSNWDDYMRWTAYLYIRLEYDGNKFTGLPRITIVAKGRKLYDPRNGITGYSNNPALVVYDWLTSKRYGLGLDSSLVDSSAIIDAANWFETQTVPYTFNGVIGQRQAFLDNLTDILLNCRSDIIWSEGKYKLLVRKYDTPVMSLTEDDVMADSFSLSVPGLADTPNRVIVKYPDESQTDYPAWIATSYYSVGDKVVPKTANGFYYECIDAGTTASTEPVWPKTYNFDVNDGSVVWRAQLADLGWASKDQVIEDTDAVLLYDNEERDIEISLIGTSNAEQANLLGIYNLERSRLNKAYSFVAHPRCLALEPGDMIQVTHSLVGWTDRVVRVMDIRLSQDGVVGLTVLEEDTSLYDDTLNLSSHTYFRTNLPDPLSPVPEATGVTFLEEEYFNKDVSYTRLKVTFTQPTSPFWDYSEVWVEIDGLGYNHYTDARGSLTIEPVKEGANYKVKLLSVSIQGVRQSIDTATEWAYSVQGKNTVPDDVTGFTATPQSDSVILSWKSIDVVDLLGYEIRKGTAWDSGIFVSLVKTTSIQLNGVPPGTHTWMLKSVDTNGKYSQSYAMATATVYGPASYTGKMSEENSFQEPASWQASTSYSAGTRVLPTASNGFYYQCTVAGTSGASQPSWPTTNGQTIADNTVTWKCLSHHTFSSIEAYNDPVYGWVLKLKHNIIANSGFETDSSGWTLGTGWVRSTTQAKTGSYSLASPGNGSGTGTSARTDQAGARGETYTFDAWAWSDTASQARLRVRRLLDSADTFSGYHAGDSTWQKLSASVTVPPVWWDARMDHAAVTFNGKVYVIGGTKDGNERLSDVWSSSNCIDWQLETDAAGFVSRVDHDQSTVVFNNKIYLMGGNSLGDVRKNDVWTSDNGRDWYEETAAAAWSVRNNHAAVVFSSELYVIGGFSGTTRLGDVWRRNGGNWTQVTLNDNSIQLDGAVAEDLGTSQTNETTQANDATANDMTLLPASPAFGDAYYFGFAEQPNGKLYINVGQAGVGTWSIGWQYWNGSSWGTLTSVNDGTSGFKVAGANSVTFSMPSDWAPKEEAGMTLYWVRARLTSFTSMTTQPKGTKAWGISIPSPRYDHIAVEFNGKLYVMGGSVAGNKVMSDVWSTTDMVNWTKEASAPWTPRRSHRALVLGSTLYLMGGDDGSGTRFNDVWSFNGTSWTQVTSSAAWEARTVPGVVVHNSKMFILGGMIASGVRADDIWYTTDGNSWTSVLTYRLSLMKDVSSGQAYFDDCRWFGGSFTGTYTSPVYDRGSLLTRRSWSVFDYLVIGTGAAWQDQIFGLELWTDVFDTNMTWLDVFGEFMAGNVTMRLGYSSNGSSWSWIDSFESFATEAKGRYVRYEATITDVNVEGYFYLKPVTYKEAYWS